MSANAPYEWQIRKFLKKQTMSTSYTINITYNRRFFLDKIITNCNDIFETNKLRTMACSLYVIYKYIYNIYIYVVW